VHVQTTRYNAVNFQNIVQLLLGYTLQSLKSR